MPAISPSGRLSKVTEELSAAVTVAVKPVSMKSELQNTTLSPALSV